MSFLSTAQLEALEKSLLNTSGRVALHDRFRSLFTLKSLKHDAAISKHHLKRYNPSDFPSKFTDLSSRFPGLVCFAQTWARLLFRPDKKPVCPSSIGISLAQLLGGSDGQA